MTPQDVRALRQELKCTARQLAAALGIDERAVFAWESGERFPTKRACAQMAALRQQGPNAFSKKHAAPPPTAADALADPRIWEIVRKLLKHPELVARVEQLLSDAEAVSPRDRKPGDEP